MATAEINLGDMGGGGGNAYCLMVSNGANDYFVVSPEKLVAMWAYNDYSHVGETLVDDDNITITYTSYGNFSITFNKACTYTNAGRTQTSYSANDTMTLAAPSSYANVFDFS